MKSRAHASAVRADKAASGGERAIEQAAREAARQWTATYRETLLRDSRLPAGGWPGTLSEARAFATSCMRAANRGASGAANAVEHERVARLINAWARTLWLKAAVRDAPEATTGEPRA